MKIFPVEAELFHVEDRWTDGRTDRHDKSNSRFSQSCEHAQNAHKNKHTKKHPRTYLSHYERPIKSNGEACNSLLSLMTYHE